MYQLLVENKTLAVIVFCIITVILCTIAVLIMRTIGMEKVRKRAYAAFVEAENRFKHGENEEKFEYVVNIVKKAVPAPFNMFITESLLRKTIQLWFNLIKDLLDDGRINNSGSGS